MDNTFNTTPVKEGQKPEVKISEFNIKDENHLIALIINAPKGKVSISSTMTLTNEDGTKTSSIPLTPVFLTGHPKEILEQLLLGAGSILASGIKKNASKIIVPEEKRIITRN